MKGKGTGQRLCLVVRQRLGSRSSSNAEPGSELRCTTAPGLPQPAAEEPVLGWEAAAAARPGPARGAQQGGECSAPAREE